MKNWHIVPDIIEVKALENYKLYLKFEKLFKYLECEY